MIKEILENLNEDNYQVVFQDWDTGYQASYGSKNGTGSNAYTAPIEGERILLQFRDLSKKQVKDFEKKYKVKLSKRKPRDDPWDSDWDGKKFWK